MPIDQDPIDPTVLAVLHAVAKRGYHTDPAELIEPRALGLAACGLCPVLVVLDEGHLPGCSQWVRGVLPDVLARLQSLEDRLARLVASGGRVCPACQGSGMEPSGVEEAGAREYVGCTECEGTGLGVAGAYEAARILADGQALPVPPQAQQGAEGRESRSFRFIVPIGFETAAIREAVAKLNGTTVLFAVECGDQLAAVVGAVDIQPTKGMATITGDWPRSLPAPLRELTRAEMDHLSIHTVDPRDGEGSTDD